MKRNIFILLLFIISLPLFAQNHMEVMKVLDGNYPYGKFGYTVTALDFNGDGYDDLSIGVKRWGDSSDVGQILMFLGNENGLPDNPNFTVSGFCETDTLEYAFASHLENLGDMNGDGYEDLAYVIAASDNSHGIEYYRPTILLGNSVMDSIPDYDYTFPSNEYRGDDAEFLYLHTLGDINGDGYNDAGFTTRNLDWDNLILYYFIVYGGENNLELTLFREMHNLENISDNDVNSIHGIGDINNDGYDDFEIGYMTDYQNAIYDYTNIIYFGRDVIEADLESDYEFIDHNTLRTTGMSCGDFNGNGIDDFIRCFAYPSELCLGNEDGYIIHYADVWFDGSESCNIREYCYGDLNGDGKDDLVWSNPNYSLDRGRAVIFLGGDNGDPDLILNCVNIYKTFGWSSAIGDFNNDGYDDLAIGAPNYYEDNSPPGVNGRVFIYAGNPNLHDTTDNTDDEINQVNRIKFKAYPNPFNPIVTFSFNITEKDIKKVKIEIYNLKGQEVTTLKVDNIKLGVNKIVWNAKNYSSGVYISKFKINGKTMAYKKVTLLK